MLKERIWQARGQLKGTETELRGQRNLTRRVILSAGELTRNSREDLLGVSARVRKNGSYGFSSTPESSPEAIRRIILEAEANARFLDAHAPVGAPSLPRQNPFKRERIEVFGNPEQGFYLDVCHKLDSYIKANCPGIVNRRVVAYADTVEKMMVHSDGTEADIAMPRSYIYVSLFAEDKNATVVERFRAFGGFGSFDMNFSNLDWIYPGIDQLYVELNHKREAVAARPGMATVILSGELAGMLAHEAVGHTVEADLVMGGSVAAHLLNQSVASAAVTLVDFAHHALGERCPLPVYVDDEGTTAEDAILIENGILRSYMHNRESALKMGMKPQGNARAWEFSDEPLIRMRNTAILPGKNSREELIASVEDGYYLMSSGNGQADTTGEFMFGVTMGYEIKNGKLGSAIRDTTISGIAFEMLETVDMLSRDLTWLSSGFCGKKQPMPTGLGGPDLRCRIMIGG